MDFGLSHIDLDLKKVSVSWNPKVDVFSELAFSKWLLFETKVGPLEVDRLNLEVLYDPVFYPLHQQLEIHCKILSSNHFKVKFFSKDDKVTKHFE